MANTYSALYFHCVFSTKERARLIKPEVEERLFAYMGGVASKSKAALLAANGMEDHVHLLLHMGPSLAPSEVMQQIKGASSRFMNEGRLSLSHFSWQDGGGYFSVSKSGVDGVIAYIEGQKDHHKKMSFQEEYRKLLTLHGVEVDERYLLG
jgi:putative transposase